VPSISSRGTGTFTGTLDASETSIDFKIKWNAKLGDVTQAHLHFAEPGVNGGIVVFLCTNLGNGPVGTPACPVNDGKVVGTIDSSDVIALTSQGIGAGQFARLVQALRAGAVYANVHSADFPNGEIRGQVEFTEIP
jgi:hypothetical protein